MKSMFGIQRSPLASIHKVSHLRIISIIGNLPDRVPANELCFLRIYEITLQTRNDRKVPYNFLRRFLSGLLVSISIAHWTTGFFCVLVPINDAIVDACMVSNVQQIKRAHNLLGLIDTSRTKVPRGKNCLVYILEMIIEAFVAPFVFSLCLYNFERETQEGHLRSATIIQWSLLVTPWIL